MSRRKFLQQAGALTGGLLLHQQLMAAFSSRFQQTINIGFIGCGDRGRGILSIMQELPAEFKVTAVCDVLDFRLQEMLKAANDPAVKSYKDHRKLLEDKSLDAVIIATPLNMHYPIAADAIAAGKHVFPEKTMTYNIPEATKLVNLAKQHPSAGYTGWSPIPVCASLLQGKGDDRKRIPRKNYAYRLPLGP